MCVHLFRAVSSPSCANFVLKQAAKDNAYLYGEEAADVFETNFYVDDLLKATETTNSAINLIWNVKKICGAGGLRLTKFISNDREVLSSILTEDHAPNIKNVHLNYDELPIERTLGMQWNIENDQLEF